MFLFFLQKNEANVFFLLLFLAALIYSSGRQGKIGNGYGESRCTFSFATTRDVKLVELDGAPFLRILQDSQALVSFARIAARAFPRRLKCVKSRLVSHEHELLLYLQIQRRR